MPVKKNIQSIENEWSQEQAQALIEAISRGYVDVVYWVDDEVCSTRRYHIITEEELEALKEKAFVEGFGQMVAESTQ